jgi:hypothetical protein
MKKKNEEPGKQNDDNNKQQQQKQKPSFDTNEMDDEFFAACIADMSFRSGIQFKISTKFLSFYLL